MKCIAGVIETCGIQVVDEMEVEMADIVQWEGRI